MLCNRLRMDLATSLLWISIPFVFATAYFGTRNGYYDTEEYESEENEDTISILNRYIDDSEVSLDKGIIKELIKDVYMEACEVE